MKVGCALAAGLLLSAAANPDPPPASVKTVELSRAFHTRSPWRLRVSQGAPVDDPVGMPVGDKIAGAIALCLQATAGGGCSPELHTTLRTGVADDVFAEPHYLLSAETVFVNGKQAAPVLIVKTASVYSGDGDQLIATQVLAYQQRQDRFVRIYDNVTGHNNNQAVSLIRTGPLRGAVISAEPTRNAPFGFWVTVNRLTPAYRYQQVLRYRSATRYADGNPLSVVESEMVNIQARLGLWHAGMPLPLPARPCPRPHLVGMALWCE